MRKFLRYLNPIVHLGEKNYSLWFPIIVVFLSCVLVEIYAYLIADDPNQIGNLAIFVFVFLIMYFAFRDGILGGFIATGITISYYLYIIYTRHYTGSRLVAGLQTTLVLALLYIFLAGTIGWLKQRIDTLIERETDERRRLQAIIQQLPVGVVVTDHIGNVIHINRQLDLLLGTRIPRGYNFLKEELPVKMTVNNRLISPSQTPLAQALVKGKTAAARDIIIERPDHKKVYVHINASVIRNRSGKIIAAASILNDVTAQKEIEKRKDDFVNIASHELKTPITSIKLFVDAMLRDKKDDKSYKILQSVKNQTERLQELVSDLLDVSRLQTGKLSFNKEKIRLDHLITENITELQNTTKEKEIRFVKKIPITIYADKFRIMQVVTNLLTNAIKYSGEGTIINVAVSKKNGYAVVSVQDFGIGIPHDQQKKIFDRLYQVTEQQGKTFPGLGMGLYICHEIVKRHHGKIWVESEKGHGSTFYFSLPLS